MLSLKLTDELEKAYAEAPATTSGAAGDIPFLPTV